MIAARLRPEVLRQSHLTTPGRGLFRRGVRTFAANGPDTSSAIQATPIFALKLAAGTLAGASIVKYGSLLLATPFEPDAKTAAVFVATPVIFFAIYFARLSRD